MLTIRLEPDRLSTEELTNLAAVLHKRCAACVEADVPESCTHEQEVNVVLETIACAIDETLRTRVRMAHAEALGVDDTTGEWLAGS
jgi:hypothetical protein